MCYRVLSMATAVNKGPNSGCEKYNILPTQTRIWKCLPPDAFHVCRLFMWTAAIVTLRYCCDEMREEGSKYLGRHPYITGQGNRIKRNLMREEEKKYSITLLNKSWLGGSCRRLTYEWQLCQWEDQIAFIPNIHTCVQGNPRTSMFRLLSPNGLLLHNRKIRTHRCCLVWARVCYRLCNF